VKGSLQQKHNTTAVYTHTACFYLHIFNYRSLHSRQRTPLWGWWYLFAASYSGLVFFHVTESSFPSPTYHFQPKKEHFPLVTCYC